jgi:hypothetical protein
MAQSVLNVIFKILKQGNADRSVIQAVKNVKDVVSQAGMVLGALGATAYAVNQAFDATVGEFVRYADGIRSFADATQMGIEDASRLVNVADDLSISQESLRKAMIAAIKDGVEPSIAQLGAMSDEYLQLAPGVERGQYLLEKFGKSGADMATLMEQGSEKIRMLSDAVQDELVVTEDAERQLWRYKIAVDELADTWLGLKVTVGQDALPLINAMLEEFNHQIEKGIEFQDVFFALGNFLDVASGVYSRLSPEIDSATQSYMAWGEAIEYSSRALGAGADAVDDYSAEMKDLDQIIGGSIGDAYEKMVESQAELNQQYADMAARVSELQGLSYLTPEQAEELRTLNDEMRDNRDAVQASADAYAERAHQIAFNMLQERLAANGLSEVEFSVLTEVAKNWGMVDEKTATVLENINRNIDNLNLENIEEFQGLLDDIMDVPDNSKKKVTAVFDVQQTGDDISWILDLINQGGGGSFPVPDDDLPPGALSMPGASAPGLPGAQNVGSVIPAPVYETSTTTPTIINVGTLVVQSNLEADDLAEKAARLARRGR